MELRGCGKYRDAESISISATKKASKPGAQRGEQRRVWERQIGREGCRQEEGWQVGHREGGEPQGCDFTGNWLILANSDPNHQVRKFFPAWRGSLLFKNS